MTAHHEYERALSALELDQKHESERLMSAHRAKLEALDNQWADSRAQVKNTVLQQLSDKRKRYAEELRMYGSRRTLPDVPIRREGSDQATRRSTRSTRSSTRTVTWDPLDPLPAADVKSDLRDIRAGDLALDQVEGLVYTVLDRKGHDLMVGSQRFTKGDSVIATAVRDTLTGPELDKPFSTPGQIVTISADVVQLRTHTHQKVRLSIPTIRAGVVLLQRVSEA